MRTACNGSARLISLGDESGWAARPDFRPATRFERRGERLGHGVWDLAYVRTKSSPESRR